MFRQYVAVDNVLGITCVPVIKTYKDATKKYQKRNHKKFYQTVKPLNWLIIDDVMASYCVSWKLAVQKEKSWKKKQF